MFAINFVHIYDLTQIPVSTRFKENRAAARNMDMETELARHLDHNCTTVRSIYYNSPAGTCLPIMASRYKVYLGSLGNCSPVYPWMAVVETQGLQNDIWMQLQLKLERS